MNLKIIIIFLIIIIILTTITRNNVEPFLIRNLSVLNKKIKSVKNERKRKLRLNIDDYKNKIYNKIR